MQDFSLISKIIKLLVKWVVRHSSHDHESTQKTVFDKSE